MLIVVIFAFLPVFGLGLIVSLDLLKEFIRPARKASLLAYSQLQRGREVTRVASHNSTAVRR